MKCLSDHVFFSKLGSLESRHSCSRNLIAVSCLCSVQPSFSSLVSGLSLGKSRHSCSRYHVHSQFSASLKGKGKRWKTGSGSVQVQARFCFKFQISNVQFCPMLYPYHKSLPQMNAYATPHPVAKDSAPSVENKSQWNAAHSRMKNNDLFLNSLCLMMFVTCF